MKTSILKAIIVDDEQSACDILKQLLLRFCPSVNVIDVQHNVEDAVNSIKLHAPDVVFLDIQMPKYAGFEIVNFFPEVPFEIIFVTAFDNYAVKAFEISAIDYILKPIEIDKLKLAVERLNERISKKTLKNNYNSLIDNLNQKKLKRLVIPINGDQKIIALSEIIAIEANESYSNIHTLQSSHLVSKNLKHFELLFEDTEIFFRSHKSWLINIQFLEKYSKSNLEITLKNNLIAKLSKLKKTDFESFIKK